jgi:hypothetical protein
MLLTSLLEPIIFHPVVLFSIIRGNFKFFIGEKTWGKMDRQGFKEDENDNGNNEKTENSEQENPK